jgi:hypothetical protein
VSWVQVWWQQQVMWILHQLAGVTNQDSYEEVWDEQLATLWLQMAQHWLQHFPQSQLLLLLVEQLQEELTGWGKLDDAVPLLRDLAELLRSSPTPAP